jgi:hypothetical protein
LNAQHAVTPCTSTSTGCANASCSMSSIIHKWTLHAFRIRFRQNLTLKTNNPVSHTKQCRNATLRQLLSLSRNSVKPPDATTQPQEYNRQPNLPAPISSSAKGGQKHKNNR